MDPSMWHKIAAVSGVAAVGLGSYGAHVFKPQNPTYKEVWQTASLYHLVHSAALLAAPMTKRPQIVSFFPLCHLPSSFISCFGTSEFTFLSQFGGLLTAGIIAFSGTCYTAALLEDRKYSALAPFGGFAFIGAWASLLF
ncbi:hypothetical protein DKX38_021560 [Salix brachista]|uniref:Transmembrane protein 256 homolog n=1 Tax=Salix brachista TaxID=2182728 RepID=A0A5N5KCI0_9ROSI|nr:hypothetical protein DKX38_021560 [Salix brachista]